MSKVMQREMTITTCNVARTVTGEDGIPVLQPLEKQVIIGGVTQPQANRIILERLSKEAKEAAPDSATDEQISELVAAATDGIVVFGLTPSTDIYELDVETFFKYASVQVKLTDEEKAHKEKTAAIEKATKAVNRAKELAEKADKRVIDIITDLDKAQTELEATTDDSNKTKLADKVLALTDRLTKAQESATKRAADVVSAEKALAKLTK